jgi:hypothetical protein
VVFRKIVVTLRRARREEAGQVFVLVLILLLLGGLIIAPLLAFMGTGLEGGRVFETKTDELYAADSGIEDGIWQIKYDELQSLSSPWPYSPHDYGTQWDFTLGEQVNEKDVTGTIENVWIPGGFLDEPSEDEAEATIEGVGGEVPKAIITGSVPDTGEYKIKLTYNKGEEDVFQYGDEFVVEEIGIWLPAGFEYVEDSSNIEDPGVWPHPAYVPTVTTSPHAGGQAVVWSFGSVPLSVFPGVQPSDVPMETDVIFQFTALRAGTTPEAQSWVETNMDLGGGINYTWDADTKVYKITSQAGDTELEAYTAKTELREVGGAIAGDYRAVGNTLMTNEYGGSTPVVRDTLQDESDATVVDIPDDAEVQAAYLYWSAWLDEELERPGPDKILFEDNCGNLDNGNWDYGDDWQESGSYTAFYVHNSETGDEVLTLHSSLALADYADKAVTISWQNWTYRNYQESDDCFQYAFYSDGTGWGDWQTTYCWNFGTSPVGFSTTIPVDYLTDSFKMRFRVQLFQGSSEYCYINNISVKVSDAIFYDDCSDFTAPQVDWDRGAVSDWQIDSGEFEGHHISGGDRYLTMSDSVDLSAYSGKTVAVSWEQSIYHYYYVDYSDCLKFAFSGNGGSSWSGYTTAFCGNNPASSYSYTIPEAYLTDDFRLRFYLENFSSSYEYVYIDDITIYETSGEDWADTTAIFKIDSTQVCFDEYGVPQEDDGEITASKWSVLENESGEYSYSCFADVTELVLAFGTEGDDGNHPGNGTYTVGDVYGDTDSEWSYAAWSLIIIYSSAETRGHQLYLYDDFIYSTMDINIDFDGDGEPGGRISGFLVPPQIEGEGDDDDAAKMTCFVGEGDDYYNYDYLRFNGSALSDGRSSNDVWNSWSVGLVEDGIDIDTFHVTWGSGLLEEGDTSAQVDLPTATDSWNLVYIILSFRSSSVTGGAISYLIVN